jgi:hypothetical protein
MPEPRTAPPDINDILDHLVRVASSGDDLPDPATPLGRMTREFFHNNWAACRDGLLRKTQRIRVFPDPTPAPRMFQFEFNLPYKRKLGLDAPVELVPGPVRGMVIYRPDLLANLHEPCVAVRLDPSMGYLHPNFSRNLGLVCLGDTTEFQGPITLDVLLENHLFPILSYQNRRPHHPADIEAARYFALDPDAMTGLEPVEPLY